MGRCSKKHPAHALEAIALILTLKRHERDIRNTPLELHTDSFVAAVMLGKTNFNQLPAKWKSWRWYLSTYNDLTVRYVGQRAVVICDALSHQQEYLYQSSSATLQVAAVTMTSLDQVSTLSDMVFASPFFQKLITAQQNGPDIQVLVKRVLEKDELAKDYYLDPEYDNLLRRRCVIDETVIHQFVVSRSIVNDVLYLGHTTHFHGGHIVGTLPIVARRFPWWYNNPNTLKAP